MKVYGWFFSVPDLKTLLWNTKILCPELLQAVPHMPTATALRPIVAEDFLARIQIDLIDMRHNPDGEYLYIGHMMDHFSKYHVLFALRTKSAAEIARLLWATETVPFR